MKTFQAVIASYIYSILVQFSSLLLLFVLFYDVYEDWFYWILLINAFFVFFILLFVFLPIVVVERNKIPACSLKESMSRYLPFLTLPLAIWLVCIFLSLMEHSVVYSDFEYYSGSRKQTLFFQLIMVLNLFLAGYTGLYTLLKKLKS